MALIRRASVEEVKAAADIVDVVSARTQLRKAGARYVGRCPFHEERTPSFSVNPQEKLFFCFGCGKGGDLISFVRETEQLDFAQAVEWLADRFNVTLEYEEASAQVEVERERRRRLRTLLDQAARFYERYLWESGAADEARAYLRSRGLEEPICREYRLGLAPRGGTLVAKARERGFTQEELLAAGLARPRGGDYFSGRLVFPLADARGRVVGFGARRLYRNDPLEAKYVNSPEGALFRKGEIVYGLDRARGAIAKQDRVCVVEGYTDVLALRQAGHEAVVASMGTALTERQLKELARLTHRLYLCFDSDAAGEAATLRGMELAATKGFDVRVVALPQGLDPADATEGFEARLEDAESYLTHRVRIEIDRAADRQEGFVRVREALARFEDTPERQEAVRLAADRLGLPRETQAGLAPRGPGASGSVTPKVLQAGERMERDALAGVIAHPRLGRLLRELGPDHFDVDLYRRLRDHLVGEAVVDDALTALMAELDARAAAEGIDETTAEQLLLRLRERRLARELSATEDEERLLTLQESLARVRSAFREYA